MSIHPGIDIVAVRTPTLPPATHTNVYVAGEGRLSVFDPASPYEDEQALLAEELDRRADLGETVERIVLTHHHHDHVSGAIALKRHLASTGLDVPIVAHPETASLLEGTVAVDELLEGNTELEAGGRRLAVRHTPGHAPGHLVFQDLSSGAVIAGDMVAGVGTILIGPEDGHLGTYLTSLEQMRTDTPTALLPSHGPVLEHADQVLAFYIAHRHQRTEQIRDALRTLGTATPHDLAPVVYPDLPAQAHPIAAVQILAHLRYLREHGRTQLHQERWTLA